MKLLKDYLSSMEIATSSPRVVYRETATREGVIAKANSPNKQNQFAVQAAPIEGSLVRQIEQDGNSARNVRNMLAVDEYKNVLVDCTGKAEQV